MFIIVVISICLISAFSFFIGFKLIKSGEKALREGKIPEDSLQQILEYSFHYNVVSKWLWGEKNASAYYRIHSGYVCIIAGIMGVIMFLFVLLKRS